MKKYRLNHPNNKLIGHVRLDGSKSISNRVLIIRALTKGSFKIDNISSCDDTQTLQRLLESDARKEYDVGHAGTTFRFLTAYLAIRPGEQILTGSARMKERPIGALVDALRSIGCQIDYLGKEGYPPLRLGPPNLRQEQAIVEIDSGISSQFLTALLLIGPALPHGLKLVLKGSMVSESYLNLTLGILKDFGIEVKRENGTLEVIHQDYVPTDFNVEADWSACSYYYSLVALAQEAEITLEGLFESSYQGDSALLDLGSVLGINAQFENGLLNLSKSPGEKVFTYNFINQPDIAQTCAVICSHLQIESYFTGLQTLKIKETQRIDALHRELAKVGGSFFLREKRENEEVYGVGFMDEMNTQIPKFDTYHDHRMAMAFAPLALTRTIEINDPDVVSKSYPGFWDDLKKLGFGVQPV